MCVHNTTACYVPVYREMADTTDTSSDQTSQSEQTQPNGRTAAPQQTLRVRGGEKEREREREREGGREDIKQFSSTAELCWSRLGCNWSLLSAHDHHWLFICILHIYTRVTHCTCIRGIINFFLGHRILGLVHAAYLNAMLSAFFTFSIRLFQRYKQANVSISSNHF